MHEIGSLDISNTNFDKLERYVWANLSYINTSISKVYLSPQIENKMPYLLAQESNNFLNYLIWLLWGWQIVNHHYQ